MVLVYPAPEIKGLRLLGGFKKTKAFQSVQMELLTKCASLQESPLSNELHGHLTGAMCLDLSAGFPHGTQ